KNRHEQKHPKAKEERKYLRPLQASATCQTPDGTVISLPSCRTGTPDTCSACTTKEAVKSCNGGVRLSPRGTAKNKYSNGKRSIRVMRVPNIVQVNTCRISTRAMCCTSETLAIYPINHPNATAPSIGIPHKNGAAARSEILFRFAQAQYRLIGRIKKP